MALPGQALTINDVCGNYEWHYTDLPSGSQKIVPVEIIKTAVENRVFVSGLYLDAIVEAEVDLQAATLALRKLDLPDIMPGACLTRLIFNSDGSRIASEEPLVGSFEGNDIIFPESEGLGVGIPSMNSYFTIASKCRFLKDRNADFVYRDEEWILCGTADLTDAWLSYHYTREHQGPTYEVDVARHVDTPTRYCLIDPFPADVWGGYNADPEGHGHIVIDMSNPDCVKLEPRVYSGFTSEDYGPLMMYNYEGNFAWFDGKSDEEIEEILNLRGGIVPSHLEGDVLTITGPIFSTKNYPTAMYGWQDDPAYVEFAPGTLNQSSVGIVAAEETEAEYYDLQGRRLATPGQGITICRKGAEVSKTIR